MRDYIDDLGQFIKSLLQDGEEYYCTIKGENSDFVRLNHNKIRQPGSVNQWYCSINLIKGSRHINQKITISGERQPDKDKISAVIQQLRNDLPFLPEDPHFLFSQEPHSSEHLKTNQLPDNHQALESILNQGNGLDLVGIYAAGGIYDGFMNSLGQKNWFESHSFNFNWSLYHRQDKAVKLAYAGYTWDDSEFEQKMASGRKQLEILVQESKTIKPGKYRVYLSPSALLSVIELLCWGGFGEKDIRTKYSALLKMVEDKAQLHPTVNIYENVQEGVAANFQSEGFIKPEMIPMIEKGSFTQSLVSPRSAKEYNIKTNGANQHEAPESIDISAGDIAEKDILSELETGLYINNLWYLNYSDRPACRMTGMTRFATFWVENGKISAPLDVMRFDETIYNMLGENLLGLTAERSFLIDPETYFARSTSSIRLPGALIKDFTLTL